MKSLNTKLAEARKIYDRYWDSYQKGDLETFSSTLEDTFEMIGTFETEITHTKEEGIAFLKAQIDEIVGKVEMRNRQIHSIPMDPMVLINETCDIYVLTGSNLTADLQVWNFYSKIRISTLLRENGFGWKVVQQHGSLPDMRVQEGETLAIDKISKENLELRDAVKRRTAELENKNRELAIEAALEKVRTVAMGMKIPKDMLDVCRAISDQLQDFGVEKIRNVQLAIIDENIGLYLCYQYFTPYDKTAVEKTEYLKSSVEHGMVKQMLASRDGYFIGGLSGRELEDFRSHRKEENHFPDPFLDRAEELSYCFLSIGEGGLGLTLYQPMADDILTLFKGFHQVFSLAYQRFRDIQKAEAQAREAQIEAALERVRSRTMAMYKSEELRLAANLLFNQIQSLGIPAWSCGYNIFEKGDKEGTGWMSSEGLLQPPFKIPFRKSQTFKRFLDSKEKGETLYVEEMSGEALSAHYEFMLSLPDFAAIASKHMEAGYSLPTFQINHVVNFKHGNLIFITAIPVPEAHDVFKRFGKVFEQTYTRFLDLQKAEAQAREAKIETALEKVRSRSLAMHKSDELNEVVSIVFKKLKELEIPATAVGIGIAIEGSKDLDSYVCGENEVGLVITNYRLPYFDNPVPRDLYHALEKQLDFFVGNYSKAEKDSFYNYVIEHTAEFKHLPEDILDMIFASPTYTISMVAVKNAVFNINDFEGKVLAEHEIEIIKRFAKVFDQAYTRFLDLQKAEAQAKEARIESALERVRSRSLAMHHSSELSSVVDTLLQEFTGLDFTLTFCIINLIDGEDLSNTVWAANPETGKDAESYYMKFEDYDFHRAMWNAWKAQDRRFVYVLEGEEKMIYDEYLYSETEFRRFPKHVQEVNKTLERYVAGFTFFKYSGLQTVSINPISEEELAILERFGKVFEQAYVRFLDLQKAEAQARESQVEAALERVRSRSLAMHKSDELKEVVNVIFDQLVLLNINAEHAGIVVDYEPKKDWHFWVAETQDIPAKVSVPYLDLVWDKQFAKAKKEGEHFFTTQLNFDEKNSFYKILLPQIEGLTDKAKDFYFSCPGLAISTVIEKDIGLYIENFSGTPYFEEENDILRRFGKVFQQTYTRFLDLKKAEAQAREAKIEVALERVRSRAMAMQEGNELAETSRLLFEQLLKLGINPRTCGFLIMDNLKESMEDWSAHIDEHGKVMLVIGTISYNQHPFIGKVVETWRRGDPYFLGELHGEELQNYYRAVTSRETNSTGINDHVLANATSEFTSSFYFEYGMMYVITSTPLSEAELEMLVRFAGVFKLTYRRFLDIQKAEAQAREAQIEASLERVRAKAMAMHSSKDIETATAVVFNELTKLGIEMERCGIGILNENPIAEIWSTPLSPENNEVVNVVTGQLDLNFHPLLKNFHQGWCEKKDFSSYKLAGDDVRKYYRILGKQPGYHFPKVAKYPDQQIANNFYFKEGGIFVFTKDVLSAETKSIFQRFTKVFEQTYTRFLDIQKAEAQAKEAIKQASLDRVRGVIASMRSAADLELITPLIFKELTILGIPFIRCGVFIIDEKLALVHAYLSSPEGNSLGVLKLPFHASELTSQTVEAWRKSVVYRQHWNKEDFVRWINQLMEQDQIQDSSTYQGTAAPPESLDLHFVPFTQGMIYVGAVSPLDQQEIELVQSLAKAFSIAYARYEDFVRLEQAKAKVESAMTELKATQSQLIQQEKLASLGQLTAGIAHEIKNPLNFVNNFSEVSIELIGEIKEERAKSQETRDETLLDEILEDIKSNLQKVHEHGTRANSIVTSMLQHSRGGSGKMEPTDLNGLIKEYVNLSFHGMRAGKNPIEVEIVLELDPEITDVPIIKEDFTRVIINLCNNAFDAMRSKKYKVQSTKYQEEENDIDYLAKLRVSSILENGQVRIIFEDNGPGIPDEIKDKILQPFFTTKKGTEGTGLGLSITHDIVKAHGGELDIETAMNKGTKFIIKLSN